jgi:apolipoprotein N-acyltransferase
MAAWLAYLLTFVFILGHGPVLRAGGLAGSPASPQRSLGRRPARLPGVWVLLEWVRGWLFTGFPWLASATRRSTRPWRLRAAGRGLRAQPRGRASPPGSCGSLVVRSGRTRAAAIAGLVLPSGAGLLLGGWSGPAPGEPLRATVVQANVQQSLKWDPESRIPTLRAYVELTRANLGSDLIVWPETAVPDFLHEVRGTPSSSPSPRGARGGAELVLGIPVLDRGRRALLQRPDRIGSARTSTPSATWSPSASSCPSRRGWARWPRPSRCPCPTSAPGPRRPAAPGRAAPRRGLHLLRGRLPRRGRPGPAGCGVPDQREQRRLVRRLPGPPPAPGDRPHAGPGERRALVRATNTGISAIIDHRGRVLGRCPPSCGAQ